MYALILPTERHPVAKRVMTAEAETDAPKPLRGAPDGTGYRDMARSESSAQELGRPADGKPTAGVGGVRSGGEAGNGRGAKGLCPKGVSKGSGAERLRKRRLTEREIGAKRNLAKCPDLIPTVKDRVVQCAKRVRERMHGITHARNGLLTVEKAVERLDKLTKGWGRSTRSAIRPRLFTR